MNVKYETIKLVVLIFLVVTSGVLTWNLWTFQPTYEVNDERHVHEVSISDPKDTGDVIVPVKLLFHMNQEHYGIVDEQKVEETMQELSGWTFFDLGEETALSREQIKKLSQGDRTLELIFPDLVPFDLYKGILRFESEAMPTGAFNRIVIQMGRPGEDGTAYFIATKDGKVYESHVNQQQVSALFNRLNKQRESFDPYEPYELPDGRLKYLPASEPVLSRYKFFSDYIEPEKFKNALFKDPNFVRRDPSDSTDHDRYNDGTSLMNVDHVNNMISYVNPGQAMNPGMEHMDKDLLKKSINYINEHAGWTDNYKYFGIDPASQKTTFQLFVKGYPVFNREGMSQIKIYWGKEDIYQYSRPYFTLDIPLPDATRVSLLSGEEAMDSLLANPDIEIEKLQELILGYRIFKDPENPKVLILDPAWYYLYDGTWERLDSDEVRGELRGLG